MTDLSTIKLRIFQSEQAREEGRNLLFSVGLVCERQGCAGWEALIDPAKDSLEEMLLKASEHRH